MSNQQIQNLYPNAPTAWEVEDGDGVHGIENPGTWTEIGSAILALYGPETVREQIIDSSDDGAGLVEWDFSDPGQLGDWLAEGVKLDTCSWHMPTEVYESDDEEAWHKADNEGRIIKGQPWSAVAPHGHTRIVWVTL